MTRRPAAAQRCLDLCFVCACVALVAGVVGCRRLSITLSLIGVAAAFTSFTITARSYRL